MTQFIIVYAQSEEESINDSKYITDRVEMLSVFLVGIFFSLNRMNITVFIIFFFYIHPDIISLKV